MTISAAGTHMIVLPGGGYAAHAPHEAELWVPVVRQGLRRAAVAAGTG